MGIIIVNNLSKRIKNKLLYSDLSFEVLEGEFYGLLALKDSGKTILSRILMGYLKQSKGKATIFDLNCFKESKVIKEAVGFVPEELLMEYNYKSKKIFKETLKFHELEDESTLNYLIEYFGFNANKRIQELNNNEKKIFLIINALIINPKLLIMDSITKDLEINQMNLLFNYLRKIKEEMGLTVFMLTDSLKAVQKHCDRAAYLYKKKIIEIESIKNKLTNDKIIKIYTKIDDLTPFLNIGAKILKEKSGEVYFYFSGDLRNISKVLFETQVINYNIEDASLEDKLLAKYSNEEEKNDI